MAEISQVHETLSFSRPGSIAFRRRGRLDGALELKLRISGTAENGTDYQPIPDFVRFAPGESVVRIAIRPISDHVEEGAETVVCEIPDQAGVVLGPSSTRRATVTIAGEMTASLERDSLVIEQSQTPGQFLRGDSERIPRSVDSSELPLTRYNEIRVGESPNIWDVAETWALPIATQAGDQFLVGFWAKGIASTSGKKAKVTLRLQMDREPYIGVEETFDLTNQWQPYLVNLQLEAGLPLDNSSMSLRYGHGKQTVCLGGLECRYLGSQRLANLPQAIHSYEGRQADATWRLGLEEATERIRNAPVSLQFVDPSAEHVTLQMIHRAYPVGTAVNYQWVAPTAGPHYATRDARRYREFIAKHFDSATDENAQQWISYANDPRRSIETAQWVTRSGLQLRGHSVLWGDPEGWPSPPTLWQEYQSRLKRPNGRQEAMYYLRQQVAEHVRTGPVVRFSGSLNDQGGHVSGIEGPPIIARWDVLNHPVLHGEMWEITGQEFLRAAIREVRELAHPATELFVNEDLVLSREDHPNTDAYFGKIRAWIDHGVPIDGIGFQSHFKSDELPAIASIARKLDRFAALGLALQVTEFDIDNALIDDQTQADFTRDFYRLLAAHPAVTGFTVWGFWEAEQWRSEEGAAMLRRDWSLTPHGQVFLDMIAKPALELHVDDPAQVRTSLPKGQYRVSWVNQAGQQQTTINVGGGLNQWKLP